MQGIVTAPLLFAIEEFPQLSEVVDRGFDNPADVDIVSILSTNILYKLNLANFENRQHLSKHKNWKFSAHFQCLCTENMLQLDDTFNRENYRPSNTYKRAVELKGQENSRQSTPTGRSKRSKLFPKVTMRMSSSRGVPLLIWPTGLSQEQSRRIFHLGEQTGTREPCYIWFIMLQVTRFCECILLDHSHNFFMGYFTGFADPGKDPDFF